MKLASLIQSHSVAVIKAIIVIACLLLVAACGAQEEAKEPPTPSPTLKPVATMTPMPTATTAPTNTPELPTNTPAATATPLPPTETPTGAPEPTPLPTDTPTVTPVLIVQVGEGKVIYHDAQLVDGLARYETGVPPWLDLLVQLDGSWYGPERNEDDIEAAPLPEGYRWETSGSFSTLPNGEAWWEGPGVEGEASLIDPEGNQLVTLQLKVDFY